jgi:ATP-dependent DNA helicase RecG
MVAMANSKGGEIIVGVREQSHEIKGVVPNQRIEEHIANVAAEVCTPQIQYDLSYETVASGSTILIIQITAGHAKPYYIKKLGLHRGTFVRIGSTCRLADREMIIRLTREGANQTYDSNISSASLSEIDPKLFSAYMQQRKARLGAPTNQMKPALLEDLQLAHGKKLTIAGALILTEDPQNIPGLSGAYIRAARFASDSQGDILDQQDITGPITKQIEESVKFLVRNTSHRATRSSGLKRLDQPEYAPLVLRELVTNAVIHRDYSLTEEYIRIAIFNDRIEVTSPGTLPGTITPENMLHRQRSRNPIIAKRIFEMGLVEGWGLGIDTIVTWATDHKKRPPFFTDEHGQVVATVYSAPLKLKDSERFSANEQRILEHLETRESISNQELRALCSLSKTQAQSALRKLTDRGILVADGRGRATRYRLNA